MGIKGKCFLPEQWGHFNARVYSKEEKGKYIGKYFEGLEIIDCYLICMENYTWDGLALLLEDNYWRFGCPPSFIIDAPD